VYGLFRVIKAWAIQPGSNYAQVIGLPIWKWFPVWFSRNSGITEIKIFYISLIFFVFSLFSKFINRKAINIKIGLVVCAAASFASIIYLLTSAPDLRFGGIYFWVFFASVGSFFLTEILTKHVNLIKLLTLISIFLAFYISRPLRFDSGIMLRSIRWDQSSANKQVLITPKDGSPSFKIYIPDGDSCGNSELPCTPEVNNNFKEIVPGDISKGFAPVK
jgi:hypothetical protein